MRASEWRVLALRLWMWDMIVQSTIYKSRREFQAEIRADGSGTGDPRHPDTNPYPMVTKDGTAQSLTLTQFGTASVKPSATLSPVSCLLSSVNPVFQTFSTGHSPPDIRMATHTTARFIALLSQQTAPPDPH